MNRKFHPTQEKSQVAFHNAVLIVAIDVMIDELIGKSIFVKRQKKTLNIFNSKRFSCSRDSAIDRIFETICNECSFDSSVSRCYSGDIVVVVAAAAVVVVPVGLICSDKKF